MIKKFNFIWTGQITSDFSYVKNFAFVCTDFGTDSHSNWRNSPFCFYFIFMTMDMRFRDPVLFLFKKPGNHFFSRFYFKFTQCFSIFAFFLKTITKQNRVSIVSQCVKISKKSQSLFFFRRNLLSIQFSHCDLHPPTIIQQLLTPLKYHCFPPYLRSQIKKKVARATRS